jgi:hypothetical protein
MPCHRLAWPQVSSPTPSPSPWNETMIRPMTAPLIPL